MNRHWTVNNSPNKGLNKLFSQRFLPHVHNKGESLHYDVDSAMYVILLYSNTSHNTLMASLKFVMHRVSNYCFKVSMVSLKWYHRLVDDVTKVSCRACPQRLPTPTVRGRRQYYFNAKFRTVFFQVCGLLCLIIDYSYVTGSLTLWEFFFLQAALSLWNMPRSAQSLSN